MRATLTNESIAAACEQATEFLADRKVNRREVLRTGLMLEEALLAYQQRFGPETSFTMDLGSLFSSARIKVSVPGAMFDPFLRSDSDTENDQFMRSAMTRMGQLPLWRYGRRANILLFTPAHRRVPEWVKLVGAVSAALVLGFLLRLAPDAARLLIQEQIVSPLLDTFMGFLNAIAGPMIFLSVVWGIYSMGDAATFSILGKRLAMWFGGFLVLDTLIVAGLSFLVFSPPFGASESGGGFSDLYRMVLDIVPSNLFTPFSRGNTLQILFVAIIIGVAMILLGEKTDSVAVLAEQLSYVVQGIMGFVARLVPAFVFGSLFNIIAGSQLDALGGAGKFFIASLAFSVLIMALHILLGVVLLRISPAAIWRKSSAPFLIGLTTASSAAAFSANLTSCTEGYGMSDRLANFGMPFGQILYKPGVSLVFWCAGVSVAEQAGLVISPGWIITALVMCIVLSAATPSIPGGMTASFAVLFAQLGLPTDDLAVILALNILLDFVITCTDLLDVQLVLACVGRRLGLLDKEKLQA